MLSFCWGLPDDIVGTLYSRALELRLSRWRPAHNPECAGK